jgi:NitT/TauT family transport system substrate-binding protein
MTKPAAGSSHRVPSRSAWTFAAVLAVGLGLAASPGCAEEIAVTQWGVSLYGAPFAVAMEEGDFRRSGIDITGIVGSAGGGSSVRNILAGETPYGEVATAAALAAARQGLDIVIVNAATRTVAESSLVTMPNSEVRSLADLAGRKVAITSPKSTSEMVFLMELQAQGIDAARIQRVFSGGYTQGLTMLEQGAVAAAVLIEPLSIVRQDRYRTVIRAKGLLPAMTTSVGITTRAFARAHPEMLRAIIAGRRLGVQAIYADPVAASRLVAKAFGMEPALAEQAVQNMIAPHMWSEGEISTAELDRIAEGLKLVGEITATPDWASLIDRSFLPADLKAEQ